MTDVPRLSIVVPCLNEEAGLETLVRAVDETGIVGVEFVFVNDGSTAVDETGIVGVEFVFVNDGSTDGTLAVLRRLAESDGRIHYLSFSRQFGKEAALLAGLRKARGAIVVTMDADLQDPPRLLPEMLRGIEEEGHDCVATRRTTREGEPPVRSWFARCFYWLMRHFSEVALVDGARDYRMMTRQVVEAILAMPEANRFTKGIYQWVGFDTKWLAFPNEERKVGETKWSFWRLFRYSLDGIMAFSAAPLMLASLLGVTFCGLSFVALLFVFVRALVFGDPVGGWPSLVCVITFLGGLQLFFIGVFGAYLAKTYTEAKRRPAYFVKEER